MTTEERLRRAVAYHEAAHALVAVLHEQWLGFVTIEPEGGVAGLTDQDYPLQSRCPDAKEVRTAVLGLLAGEAGACLSGFADAEDARHGASRDYEMASDFIAYLESSPSEQQVLIAELAAESRALVEREWAAVAALAQELLEHGRVSGDLCQMIVVANLRDSGPEEQEALRMLRALIAAGAAESDAE